MAAVIVPRAFKLQEPSIEPVTLIEGRLWCRVDPDDTTQDWAILLLIRHARERAELITQMALGRTTYELQLDEFPPGRQPIEVPFPPLVSIDYATVATSAGDVELSGSPTELLVETGPMPGRIQPVTAWPTVTSPTIGAFRLGYTAGYATNSQMPASIRLYLMARLSTYFENREQMIVGGNVQPMPRDFIDGALDGFRYGKFFA